LSTPGGVGLGIIVLIVAIHVAICTACPINSERAEREMTNMRSAHHRD